MSQLVPENTPGVWNTVFYIGATWPASTVEMLRDGVAVVPVSASLLIHDADGSLLMTVVATIDGGGIMTIGPVSAATTAALAWQYGNLLFRVTEGDGTITDLLAGNATAVNRAN